MVRFVPIHLLSSFFFFLIQIDTFFINFVGTIVISKIRKNRNIYSNNHDIHEGLLWKRIPVPLSLRHVPVTELGSVRGTY